MTSGMTSGAPGPKTGPQTLLERLNEGGDQLQWETCSCDWCSSEDGELLFSGPDRLHPMPGTFHMVRCNGCGLYRQNPRLAWLSLSSYYPEDYASYPKLSRESGSFLRRLDKRYGPWKRLRAIERFQKGGKLLEVGCGTGYFLEETLRSGRWDVTGVEPTRSAAEYTRQKLGVPVIQSRFAEAGLQPGSFDVVVMWNVVEHFDRPIQDLRLARQLLKDHGWLVFSIPNIESLEARLFGPYWVGWDMPRHLYLFPRKVMLAIMKELGFHTAALRCLSTSYSVLGHSLDFWSQTWGDRHPTARRLLLRFYRSIFARAGLVLPLGLLDRLNLSTIITVFAQKTPAEQLDGNQ
jgi:SAM-dependent methyltransferase